MSGLIDFFLKRIVVSKYEYLNVYLFMLKLFVLLVLFDISFFKIFGRLGNIV